jgi:hypothetical protein
VTALAARELDLERDPRDLAHRRRADHRDQASEWCRAIQHLLAEGILRIGAGYTS